MKCPACDRELHQLVAGNITVDACKGGCGGIWFDRFELEKVDEPEEDVGMILDDMPIDLSIDIDPRKVRHCPRCKEIVLQRHRCASAARVLVDECPSCGGVWLDFGELYQIRAAEEHRHEEERATAVRQLGEILRGRAEG